MSYTAPTFVNGGAPPLNAANLNGAFQELQRLSAAGTNPVLNVKDYGAVGDGTADDTAAIQAAFNVSTLAVPRAIFFPRGTYKITSGINVPFAPGTKIYGEGRWSSYLRQHTAGQPVLAFRTDLTHSITVTDISIGYNTQQTTAGSVAVLYQVAGGSPAGFFHHVYERVDVLNSYRGFALADNDGTQTLWSVAWRSVNFFGVKDRAISLAPAVPIGIPTVELDHVGVYNTANGGLQSTGPAFFFSGCEVTARAIDVEGWWDEAFWFVSGGYLNIRGLHVEHHVFNKGNSRLIYAANGPVSVDAFSVVGDTTASNTDTLIIVAPDVGSSVVLRNGHHNVTTALGTSYLREVVYAGTGIAGLGVTIENVTKSGGGINQPGTGGFATYIDEYRASLGALPTGEKGLSLPKGGKVYIYSPDGTRYALSVANGGTLSVVAAPSP